MGLPRTVTGGGQSGVCQRDPRWRSHAAHQAQGGRGDTQHRRVFGAAAHRRQVADEPVNLVGAPRSGDPVGDGEGISYGQRRLAVVLAVGVGRVLAQRAQFGARHLDVSARQDQSGGVAVEHLPAEDQRATGQDDVLLDGVDGEGHGRERPAQLYALVAQPGDISQRTGEGVVVNEREKPVRAVAQRRRGGLTVDRHRCAGEGIPLPVPDRAVQTQHGSGDPEIVRQGGHAAFGREAGDLGVVVGQAALAHLNAQVNRRGVVHGDLAAVEAVIARDLFAGRSQGRRRERHPRPVHEGQAFGDLVADDVSLDVDRARCGRSQRREQDQIGGVDVQRLGGDGDGAGVRAGIVHHEDGVMPGHAQVGAGCLVEGNEGVDFVDADAIGDALSGKGAGRCDDGAGHHAILIAAHGARQVGRGDGDLPVFRVEALAPGCRQAVGRVGVVGGEGDAEGLPALIGGFPIDFVGDRQRIAAAQVYTAGVAPGVIGCRAAEIVACVRAQIHRDALSQGGQDGVGDGSVQHDGAGGEGQRDDERVQHRQPADVGRRDGEGLVPVHLHAGEACPVGDGAVRDAGGRREGERVVALGIGLCCRAGCGSKRAELRLVQRTAALINDLAAHLERGRPDGEVAAVVVGEFRAGDQDVLGCDRSADCQRRILIGDLEFDLERRCGDELTGARVSPVVIGGCRADRAQAGRGAGSHDGDVRLRQGPAGVAVPHLAAEVHPAGLILRHAGGAQAEGQVVINVGQRVFRHGDLRLVGSVGLAGLGCVVQREVQHVGDDAVVQHDVGFVGA